MGGIEHQRREDRKHGLRKIRIRFLALRFGQFAVVKDMHTRVVQFWLELVAIQMVGLLVEFQHPLSNEAKLFPRR